MNNSLCLFCLIALLVLALGASTEPATKAAPKPPANVPPHNRINLWDAGKAPGIVAGDDTFTDPEEPTLDCWLPAAPASGAAVVIFPGGAYTHLAPAYEGADLAEKFAANHIAAFVLRYRHAPRYAYPIPMIDAERAVRLLKSKAAEYQFDPAKLGVCGFSAGGHLAATVSTQFDKLPKPPAADAIDALSSRPAFALLIYPVITFTNEPLVHLGSRKALTNGDAALYQPLSAELHVTANTPPTFLVHAAPDTTVPVENSILYFQALRQNKVEAELHIFAQGKHGFGIGGTDPVLSTWPDMAIRWMTKAGMLSQTVK